VMSTGSSSSVGLSHLQALAWVAARTDKLEIQTIDGAPVKESGLERALLEAGFGTSPRVLFSGLSAGPCLPEADTIWRTAAALRRRIGGKLVTRVPQPSRD
jgi:hypothetical protein